MRLAALKGQQHDGPVNVAFHEQDMLKKSIELFHKCPTILTARAPDAIVLPN